MPVPIASTVIYLNAARIESILMEHPKVAEVAAVGTPHAIKGQCLYLFVVPTENAQPSKALYQELSQWVRERIGPVAKPDDIQWTQELPKTRSGKVMRRILRKIAARHYQDLGDTSTLADPSVVADMIETREKGNIN